MILNAKDIEVSFKKENQTSLWGKEHQLVLKGVSLELNKGECLGIIGESGSGKSTLGRVLIGLLKPNKGEVLLDGISLYHTDTKASKQQIKHRISVVFQDYTSSVNPRFKVKDIIGESLRVLKKKYKTMTQVETKIEDLLEQVGLDASMKNRYPHELSGGQLQRVCIARAIAIEPEVILFDEAISSLDISTQTQVMDLLIQLRKKYHFSYIFITHDLSSVTYLCDRVIFFQDGMIVEQVDEISKLAFIQNEYSKKLLSAVIGMEIEPKRTLQAI